MLMVTFPSDAYGRGRPRKQGHRTGLIVARKSRVVGKPGKPITGPVGAGGSAVSTTTSSTTRKHQTTSGSGGTAKHSPRTKHNPHQRKRKFTPNGDVDCCAAEALTTLRWFAGERVGYEDTLALYWRTAGDADAGATILDTLKAMRPCGPRQSQLPRRDEGFAPTLIEPLRFAQRGRTFPHGSLILGVSLPEPHAIAVTPDGRWWSWGEPFNPAGWPELVVEEAWAVCL